MKVISLFDGISCGLQALWRAGFYVSEYHSYEIDKHAIIISAANADNIVRYGSVLGADWLQHRGADLLLGGSPCQDLSSAGKGEGLTGARSSLFWEYVEALTDIKPRYFLFENVASMKKVDRQIISDYLNCQPIEINSALVSAQKRRRLYWTNIPNVKQPEDRHIYLDTILERPGLAGRSTGRRINERGVRDDYNRSIPTIQTLYLNEDPRKSNCLTTVDKDNLVFEPWAVKRTPSRELMWFGGKCKDITKELKSLALTTNQDRWCNSRLIAYKDFCRYLTPIEQERLQGLPDNYTASVPPRARVKAIGNGWQVDTIAHILSYMQ